MTCGPAAVAAVLDAPVLDLLLEQPVQAATTMATPATPTAIPRFTTALLRVADRHLSSWPPWAPSSTPADLTAWTQAHDARFGLSDPSDRKQSGRAQGDRYDSGENSQAPFAEQRMHESEVRRVIVTVW